MRWYDIDPNVYMAISMIECSSLSNQIDYANYIIREIKIKDNEMNYIKNSTKSNLRKEYTRWYDKNETVSRAFSYLKSTSKDLQKEVALSVLDYMKTPAA